MSSEKFCLRWNDFERNISSAFKDIRDAKEFFDITIACEDEQLQAHKVILSACSPFFKNVLRRNQHQHPLLYLKGVSFRDMEAVLNFMYHGEVNVAQDDLNSFLQVAEDLRVKGLTQNDSINPVNEKKNTVNVQKPEPRHESNRPHHSEYDPTPASKRPRPTPPIPRIIPQPAAQQEDHDIEEIVPVVKSEPRDPTPILMTAPIQPVVPPMEQTMAMYDDGSQQIQGSMMMTTDTEQYDDNYAEEYEGQYGDQSYDSSMVPGGQDNSGADGKSPCPYCDRSFHPSSLQRHILTQHVETEPIQCDLCKEVFRHQGNLNDHIRRKHKIYKSKKCLN
eukprot:GFUD01001487.1.p1 GENE.GFUD01001487.1~~GFUD01001487.1.p1  ORF type:complete len:334 (+),score=82.16 GFUD01001487.1:143-1144(+)